MLESGSDSSIALYTPGILVREPLKTLQRVLGV
jgi:hypothetical protein